MLDQLCDDKTMKSEPEYVEGTEAWDRFSGAMRGVLSVPHAEIQRRIAEHKKESARNPNRRGPKKKRRTLGIGAHIGK